VDDLTAHHEAMSNQHREQRINSTRGEHVVTTQFLENGGEFINARLYAADIRAFDVSTRPMLAKGSALAHERAGLDANHVARAVLVDQFPRESNGIARPHTPP
jgi:hypothetical protein